LKEGEKQTVINFEERKERKEYVKRQQEKGKRKR
jgi:hypothetical protein